MATNPTSNSEPSRAGLRDRLECSAARAAAAILAILPDCAVVLLARALGTLAWLINAKRRRIARENLTLAMPDAFTGRQLRRFVRLNFLYTALTLIEILRLMSARRRKRALENFTIDGIDSLKAASALGRGGIFLGSHVGNWELLGSAVARHVPFSAFAKPFHNPHLYEYLCRARIASDITVLNTEEGFRPILRSLRAGRFVSIFIDHHSRAAAVNVKFFGRDAATTAIAATLALRFDLPVFCGYDQRDGLSLRHHGRLEGPIPLIRTGDPEADIAANTQLFNDAVERAIRPRPEQWLWMFSRWRLVKQMARQAREAAQRDA